MTIDANEGLTNASYGTTVTRRIKQVKQPRGGYINPKKKMKTISLGEGIDALNPEENIHASLVGLAVDYMTRFMSGTPAKEAFRISLRGASILGLGKLEYASDLIAGVSRPDDKSIICATKLAGFDVCYRAGRVGYKPVENINPDKDTIDNARVMIERSLHFLNKFGPKVLDGLRFDGGYTTTVVDGDGDFMTEDTLWELKVSKNPPKKDHTLQLLMYWRMGLHSIHPEYRNIKYLGIYNPRKNEVSRIAVTDISKEVIDEVESEVIGY